MLRVAHHARGTAVASAELLIRSAIVSTVSRPYWSVFCQKSLLIVLKKNEKKKQSRYYTDPHECVYNEKKLIIIKREKRFRIIKIT